jgi:hypothetical protein
MTQNGTERIVVVMPGLDSGIHPQGRRWLQTGLPGQAWSSPAMTKGISDPIAKAG